MTLLYIYTLNISSFTRYSAATDLRWGENFNKFLFCNSLLHIAVKKLRKAANICLSYQKISVAFFMAHSVVYYSVSQKIPLRDLTFFLFFHKRLRIFNRFFTHLL